MIWIIVLITAIVFMLAQYFSERFCVECSTVEHELISFAAGIAVSYLFLVLIPEFINLAEVLSNFMFIFVLAGFVIFYLIEKHIYQYGHHTSRVDLLTSVHTSTFFIYHFLVGLLLVSLARQNLLTMSLFFFPVIFHTVITNLSLHTIHHISHRFIAKHPFERLFLASSVIFGVLFALIFTIPHIINIALLGFMAGALLLIVIREALPTYRKSVSLFFVIGVILYSLIIIFTWGLVV